MKHRLIVFAVLLSLCLTACGAQAAAPSSAPAAAATPEPTAAPTPAPAPELEGVWRQVNNDSATSYQEAVVTADTITIYWINTEKDTKALYWAGSFTPPADGADPYVWESANDTEQTAYALLASTSETKAFTYQGGEIIYEVTALGMTKTVRLQKVS